MNWKNDWTLKRSFESSAVLFFKFNEQNEVLYQTTTVLVYIPNIF